MIDWWIELPKLYKFGFAFVVLGISAAMWLAGWFWPWGWGVGGVLLFAAIVVD